MSKNFILDVNHLPAICDHSWKDLIIEALPINVRTGEINIGSGNYQNLTKFIKTDSQTGKQTAKETIILGDINNNGKAIIKNEKYAVIEPGQSLDPQNIRHIINNPNSYKSKKEIEDLKVKTASKFYKEPFEKTKANNPNRAKEAIAKIDEFQSRHNKGEIKTANQLFNKIQNEPILESGRIETCRELVEEQIKQIKKQESCEKQHQFNQDNIRLSSDRLTGLGLALTTISIGSKLLPLLGFSGIGALPALALTLVGFGVTCIGIYTRNKDRDNQDNFMTGCIQKK